MTKLPKDQQPGQADSQPGTPERDDRDQHNSGDDIPDTPPNEPKPAPIRDPKPPGRPKGPYVA
jgi:hypothetical protein